MEQETSVADEVAKASLSFATAPDVADDDNDQDDEEIDTEADALPIEEPTIKAILTDQDDVASDDDWGDGDWGDDDV